MVSGLDSGSSHPGHCVVFLGKTLTAEEMRLSQFGSQVRFGAANNVKFGRVRRTMGRWSDS